MVDATVATQITLTQIILTQIILSYTVLTSNGLRWTMAKQLFPKGIAKGENFFNRNQEIARLMGNIESGTHTLLTAPRRYGKSSLAKEAIRRSAVPYCEIDLFVAVDDVDVGNKIVAGVGHLIQKISIESEKWFYALKDFFNKAHKKWTIGFHGLKLELIPDDKKTVAQNILDVLEALEFILKKKSQRAVIFIDEFQEILETKTAQSIEGAIRHFAQESEWVSFIFSGSNRRMLKKIFNSRSRPLYAFCDEIRLDRIDASYYYAYLNKVAKKTFGAVLSDLVIDRILQLSDRHPRYVYVLATEVWLRCTKQLPTVHDVEVAWHEYIEQKNKDVRLELSSRTQPQMKLLTEISMGKNSNLSGKESLLQLELTSSTVVQALKVLESLDYIERASTGEYRMINPMIKDVIRTSVSGI